MSTKIKLYINDATATEKQAKHDRYSTGRTS